MLPAGIRFNDCYFSEPTPLTQWTPPRCAGLFVVLTRDSNWAPRPYQPVHFGEFGNNLRHILRSDSFHSVLQPVGTQTLYVSTLALPFSTTAQRRAIRAELIQAYNPISQAEESGSLFFEPTAETAPRRRIGFLP